MTRRATTRAGIAATAANASSFNGPRNPRISRLFQVTASQAAIVSAIAPPTTTNGAWNPASGLIRPGRSASARSGGSSSRPSTSATGITNTTAASVAIMTSTTMSDIVCLVIAICKSVTYSSASVTAVTGTAATATARTESADPGSAARRAECARDSARQISSSRPTRTTSSTALAAINATAPPTRPYATIR